MDPNEMKRFDPTSRADPTDAMLSLYRHCTETVEELKGFVLLQSADKSRTESALSQLHERLLNAEERLQTLKKQLSDEKAALYSAKSLIKQMEKQSQSIELIHKFAPHSHHTLLVNTFPAPANTSKRKSDEAHPNPSLLHFRGVTPVDDVADAASHSGQRIMKRYKPIAPCSIHHVNKAEFEALPADMKEGLCVEELNAVIDALNLRISERQFSSTLASGLEDKGCLIHERDIAKCTSTHPQTNSSKVILVFKKLLRLRPMGADGSASYEVVSSADLLGDSTPLPMLHRKTDDAS